MDHGKKNPPVRQRTTYESLEQDEHVSDCNLPKLEKTTTIIRLQKSSSTYTAIGLWSYPPIRPKENDWTNLNPPSPKKVTKPSFQVFLWETLMTVALLIMALWMQSLPERELPQTMKSDTWPTLETMRLPMRF